MSDELLELDLALRELGSVLLADSSLAATLDRVTGVACRCVAAGAGSTITLIRGGSPYTAAGSDDRGRAIDDRQYELNEGPAIDALKTGEPQVADDVCADERWPEIGPAARVRVRGAGVGAPPRRAGGHHARQRPDARGVPTHRRPAAGGARHPRGHRAGEGRAHGAPSLDAGRGVRRAAGEFAEGEPPD